MNSNFLRKTSALVLSVMMLVSITGCNPKTKDNSSSGEEASSGVSTESQTADTSGSDMTTGGSTNASSSDGKSSTKSPSKTVSTGKTNTTTKSSGSKTKVFKVEDYGAKGDGKTNDGIAIANAIEAATSDYTSGEKIVQFRANATYRVTSIPANSNANRLLFLYEADNVKIRGNNTKLLLKAPIRVAYFKDTTNCEMSGFVIDYSPKPFVKGKLIAKDATKGTMDFQVNGDLGFSGSSWNAPNPFFAFRNRTNERMHHMISRYEKLGEGKYRMVLRNESLGFISRSEPGEEFILPYANNSHVIGGIYELNGNSEFRMTNVRIMSAPDFGFDVRLNVGKMYFTNVDFQQDESLSIHLVQWRDGFHVKDNTAPIVWSGCDIGPLGDDAYNLSSVNLNVNTVNADQRTIGMTPAEGAGARPAIKPGDEFVAYDLKSGKEIGRGKVEAIVASGDPVCFRSNVALPDLRVGMQIGVYSYANPGLVIKDSNIEGTVRVRSMATFQNVKFNVFWVMVENETYVEGPIPKDILFKNCTFATPYTGNPNIFTVGTQNSIGKRNADYKCKNIVLEGCKFVNGKYYIESGNQVIFK